MKRLLAVILTLAMLLAVPMSASALDGLKPGEGTGDGGEIDIGNLTNWKNPFVDVNKTDWFYNDVTAAVRAGLFTGTSDKTFEPLTQFSRSMMVTVLYRMFGAEPVGDDVKLPFTDVKEKEWYTDAIAWAYANEIVNGTSATTFAPDMKITRQDMLVILYRATIIEGIEIKTDEVLAPYADKNLISGYAKDAMAFGVQFGLVKGGGDNTLNPTGKATRAEAATILLRYSNPAD